MIRKLLGVDWLARKLGYVEQDVRALRTDLTDLVDRMLKLERFPFAATVEGLLETSERLEKLEGVVRDLLLGDAPAKGRETSEGYRETAAVVRDAVTTITEVARRVGVLERIGSAERNAALRAELDERLAKLEAEVRAIPRPNVVDVPPQGGTIDPVRCRHPPACLSTGEHGTHCRACGGWLKEGGGLTTPRVPEPRPEPLRVPVVERGDPMPVPVKPHCHAPALVSCSCKGECSWPQALTYEPDARGCVPCKFCHEVLMEPGCGDTCSICLVRLQAEHQAREAKLKAQAEAEKAAAHERAKAVLGGRCPCSWPVQCPGGLLCQAPTKAVPDA